MSAPEHLVPLVGRWTGTTHLHLPWLPAPRDHSASESTAEVTLVVGGAFVSIAYAWTYEEHPQEGLLLLNHEAAHDVVHAVWMDTWHMRERPLYSAGTRQADGAIAVVGSYEAPPGPDWGWRTELTTEGEGWRLVMHNVSPEGDASLAVDARYVRAGDAA